ncbi:uncharacterized protein N0V89_011365 [Didymosphaeria variabile]|uniref:Asl1-like glycosyl hydrolase catalytic domain-containing protein n=1 Tax=Didymosphaeria variabile TaxID=1932322 RepID=A0A9W8X9P5_9PLEO|nr:uncharacterized protein N0V89_011365 [Didymosphaeria variabile]KAJ4345236.1 hypothetical protein N0V89_011365 [Didymosphaeria variabile]
MLQSSLVLALAGLASFSTAAPTAFKRGAGKRGLGFAKNAQDKANMFTGSGQVTWAYDWEARATDAPGFGVPGVEFVPMLHDGGDMFAGAFPSDCQGALDAGAKHILSINEPDICGNGGTCMSVDDTVKAHRNLVQPFADSHPDVTIVSPAYSNAGVDAMNQFLGACTGCRIDHIATHWYGPDDVEAFKAHVSNVHDITQKPIWVTEFQAQSGDTEKFMRDAITWLDNQDWVYRYAYFSVEASMTNGMSLNNLGNIFSQ